MVDLDPIGSEDEKTLLELLTQHHTLTGSSIAGFILSDWQHQIKNFIKVFPRDYKKVVQSGKLFSGDNPVSKQMK
jgi:glutamate synthase (NADPH/NADH) large chain